MTSCEGEYERVAEYERLVATVAVGRRNMLLHGEAGAGKTRLLRQFAATQRKAAYVSLSRTLRGVLEGLLSSTAEGEKTERGASAASLTGMKRVVDERLARHGWTLVLDHVQSPSANVVRLMKDLHDYGRTPLLFAGRSGHMEDIGGFRSFCIDRSARVELKPWLPPVALAFAQRHAATLQLAAENLEEAVKGIATLSGGYPGRIVDMLGMAATGNYSSEDNIKFHTLYLDYLMRGR